MATNIIIEENTVFNPETWGPKYWFFLMTLSLSYPDNVNAVVNAWSYLSMRRTAQLGRWLGRVNDATTLDIIADKLKASMKSLMFNGTAICQTKAIELIGGFKSENGTVFLAEVRSYNWGLLKKP